MPRTAPDTISLQQSPLMDTEGWTSAEYHLPNSRNDISSSTPSNKNATFHLGSDIHQCQSTESTNFPSMNRGPNHNASLHSPESRSNTNADSYFSSTLPTQGYRSDSSAQAIYSLGPQLIPNALEGPSIPAIDPSGPLLFPDQQPNILAPPVDPSGDLLFPDQQPNVLAPPVDPSGDLLFPDQQPNMSISLIPHSIRLSSPEIATAVGNMVHRIQQTLETQSL
ncbi:hypothetical protein BDV37DRAFT_267156 [Aspergillus pseudonomiae]|uniref:Uncharacterized protein n=1 Tax=Aspergillus pseudonomiae TaxID=1506151 RepID=A0A5N7CRX6_9EURO|nr:uncharacterized protein BDV37DRAFT_267156 [Aspergillus pseudonomiae]KAE8396884.1 hypothetical protein BDV37DRAFT_267156 [Aspergillus pseudonomiae]